MHMRVHARFGFAPCTSYTQVAGMEHRVNIIMVNGYLYNGQNRNPCEKRRFFSLHTRNRA